MRRRPRLDSNQDRIVDVLRSIGCSVQSLAAMGGGVPDLLVGRCGRNYLMEIKDGDKPPSRQALTGIEGVWHDDWRGQVAIVNSVESALAVVGAKVY